MVKENDEKLLEINSETRVCGLKETDSTQEGLELEEDKEEGFENEQEDLEFEEEDYESGDDDE